MGEHRRGAPAIATLLIAKLDRLARNVAFVASLMETGVDFRAADIPNADRFMLHIYAAVAEEEARKFSQRTRAALAVAKKRGVKLGNPTGDTTAAPCREAGECAPDRCQPHASDRGNSGGRCQVSG